MSLVDELHLFSLLHTHSHELPVEDPGKDIQQKPWAINSKRFYCVFIAFKRVCFPIPRARAHTSQALPMCKTATRLSADRLAAESPRVIHQSRVTMSHLCRGTILKRPGGGGGAERERLLAARQGNPTPHEGSRKKVTLWENWNCMCVFNCALYFKGQLAALSLHFRFGPPQTGTCNLAAPTSMNN